MIVSATSCNGRQQLDPRRSRAVDLLVLGKTDAEVAAEVGANRTSLWRWRQEPLFQAELARRRAELWADSLDRFAGLLARSLDVLADALQDGDRRVALQLVRASGVGEALAEQRALAGDGSPGGGAGTWISDEQAAT